MKRKRTELLSSLYLDTIVSFALAQLQAMHNWRSQWCLVTCPVCVVQKDGHTQKRESTSSVVGCPGGHSFPPESHPGACRTTLGKCPTMSISDGQIQPQLRCRFRIVWSVTFKNHILPVQLRYHTGIPKEKSLRRLEEDPCIERGWGESVIFYRANYVGYWINVEL